MKNNINPNPPKRILNKGFTLAVTVGGIIGLGILRTPGEVASIAPNPLLFVSLWLIGGLFVLLSLVVVSELIAITPRSGGTYALVRHAYGAFPGFVMGWVDWLSFVADIALKAVVVVEFAVLLISEIDQWRTLLAIIVSTAFAALQLRSIRLSANIQKIAAAVMALIVIGFTMAIVLSDGALNSSEITMASENGFGKWSLVIASLIYAYDGWIYAAYFSGEIKDGAKAIVRASLKGLLLVILLYLFLVSALAWKIPLKNLAGSELALSEALEITVSPLAGTIVLIAAILMTLAHQNLLYMSTPRILQALAQDGLAIEHAGKSSKGGNPIFAVILSWGLSVGLILIGGFEFLLHLSVFFYIFLYALLVAGVIILRSRQPDTVRPYRAWGHPWSTYVCLLIWVALAFFQVIAQIETAAYAIIMVLISWPIFRFIMRLKQTRFQRKKY